MGWASRGELLHNIYTSIENGDMDAAQQAILEAQEKYMGEDVFMEMPNKIRMKLGYEIYETDENGNVRLDNDGNKVRKKLENNLEAQRELLIKIGADDRFIALYEDASYSAGHVGAMTRLLNQETGEFYNETDLAKTAKANIARLQSQPPAQAVRNTRWQSFFTKTTDAEGNTHYNLHEMGKKLLDPKDGLYHEAHMPYFERGFGRPNVYAAFAQRDIWDYLGQNNRPLQEAVNKAGYHPGWETEHADSIKVDGQDTPIRNITSQQIVQNPQIAAAIQARALELPAEFALRLAGNISANANLSAIQPIVQSLAQLKKTIKDTGSLHTVRDRSVADQTINNIVQTTTEHIGTAMQSGMDPRTIMNGIVSSAPADERDGLFKRLKSSLESDEKTATYFGTPDNPLKVSVKEIIAAFNEASKRIGSRQPNDVETRTRFFEWAHQKGATSVQAAPAWQLVEAYLGKPAPKSGGRAKGPKGQENEEYYYDEFFEEK